jgi:hypothetical protein
VFFLGFDTLDKTFDVKEECSVSIFKVEMIVYAQNGGRGFDYMQSVREVFPSEQWRYFPPLHGAGTKKET